MFQYFREHQTNAKSATTKGAASETKKSASDISTNKQPETKKR